MQGIITGRDVIAHPYLIARHYGARAFARCILAIVRRKRCTFLEMAWNCPECND